MHAAQRGTQTFKYVASQVAPVTGVVRQIARIPLDDGLAFNADSAHGETIREEDFYSGVRVHLDCRLATARPTSRLM
jgi:hypothetical protein